MRAGGGSLLARLRATDAAAAHAGKYACFVVAGERVGQVQQSLVGLLLACSGPTGPVFEQLDAGLGLVQSAHPSAEHRSDAMAAATQHLIAHKLIKRCHGDLFPIAPAWNAPALCVVDRNAAPFFGTTSVGVHLHCYVRSSDAGLQVWMAQRAMDKSNFPGLWDPTVAGGQPVGLSLGENMCKEAAEEAGLAPAQASRAHSAGVLSQMTAKPDGSCLKQSAWLAHEPRLSAHAPLVAAHTRRARRAAGLYFVWDLEVAEDWSPRAADGEVERFERWSMQRVEHEVREGDCLRPAMRLVMADFLIRHGVITPDNEPDFERIVLAMHQERLVL